MASSMSMLATISLVPACLLKGQRPLEEVLFQSPSAAAVRQPTRRSSIWTNLVSSVVTAQAYPCRPAALLTCIFEGAFGRLDGTASNNLRNCSQ